MFVEAILVYYTFGIIKTCIHTFTDSSSKEDPKENSNDDENKGKKDGKPEKAYITCEDNA